MGIAAASLTRSITMRNIEVFMKFYVYALVVILLFVGRSGGVGFSPVPVPQPILYVVILLLNTLVFFYVAANNYRFHLGVIGGIILVRATFVLIAWAMNENTASGLRVAVTQLDDLMVILVFFSYRFRKVEELINSLTGLAIIVLALELAFAMVLGFRQAGGLFGIKPYLQIPMGGSNYISCLVLVLLAFYYPTRKKGIASTLVLVVGVLTIVLTRSSSGYITLGVLCVAALFSGPREGKPFRVLMGLTVAFFLALVVIGISPDYFSRFFGVLDGLVSGNLGESLNGRGSLFQQVGLILEDKWFTGAGPQYRELMPDGMLAHNLILDAFVSGGIGCLVSTVLLFGAVFAGFVPDRACKTSYGAILATLAVVISGMVEPNFGTFSFDVIFLMLVGLSYGNREIARR